MTDETRRLVRSETDRMIAGVCGGIAAFFGFDPTLVRLAFVVATLLGGAGPVLYLAVWLLAPTESRTGAPPREAAQDAVDELREQARRGADEARAAYERWRAGSTDAGGGTATGTAEAPGAAERPDAARGDDLPPPPGPRG